MGARSIPNSRSAIRELRAGLDRSVLFGRSGPTTGGARVLDMLKRGAVRIGFEIQEELGAIQALMHRYTNVPMSLADACLVRLAELTGLPILTLDNDFAIYRAHGRRPLTLITPERHSLHEP